MTNKTKDQDPSQATEDEGRNENEKIKKVLDDVQDHAFKLLSLLTMQVQFLFDNEQGGIGIEDAQEIIVHGRTATELAQDEAQRILDLLSEII
jgi:hypothetical protein